MSHSNPKFITLEGEETTAEDPQRGVWYAARPECGYWTDDWSKLKKIGPGIPCCPVCSCVGMQITAGNWINGMESYQGIGNDRYVEFVNHAKEICGVPLKQDWMSRYNNWKKENK